MLPKVEFIYFSLFLFAIFLVQPSTTTKTEHEKLAELTEKFDTWQSEMNQLTRQLKSQVETLTEQLQSKHGETSSEQSCTFSGKGNSLARKKRQGSSTQNATQSCQELRNKGHFANGIYQVPHPAEVAEPKKIEAVSCEFEAANDIRGESLGSIALKTKSVHFQVQRNSEFTGGSGGNAAITFEKENFNYGKAMDIANGVFTAPVAGIYHFAFSGMTKTQLQIILRVNEVENVASTSVDASSTNNAYGLSVSLSSSVYLNEDDKVSVYKSGTGTLLETISDAPNTFFSGWLVEEVELMP